MTENCVVVVDLVNELVVHYTSGSEVFGQKISIVYDSDVYKNDRKFAPRLYNRRLRIHEE